MDKKKPKLENNQANSSYGGSRAGAGRKAGAATTKTREIANKAIEEGVSPLEYMLSLMRAPAIVSEDAQVMLSQQSMRFEAAKAAAPYVHPRLSAVDHTGDLTISLASELAALNSRSSAT